MVLQKTPSSITAIPVNFLNLTGNKGMDKQPSPITAARAHVIFLNLTGYDDIDNRHGHTTWTFLKFDTGHLYVPSGPLSGRDHLHTKKSFNLYSGTVENFIKIGAVWHMH